MRGFLLCCVCVGKTLCYNLTPNSLSSLFLLCDTLCDRRALIFTFPYNVIRLFRNLFVCLILSMVCGVVYWHVRVGREQEHLWDRIGLYHALLAVVPIPFLLIIMNDGTSFGTTLVSFSLSLLLTAVCMQNEQRGRKRRHKSP